MPEKCKLASLRKIEDLPGFVVNYLICGPFNDDLKLTSCKAFGKNYLNCPEDKAAPKAGQRVGKNGPVWKPYAVKYDFIANLLYSYSKKGIVSYAAAYIHSPKAQNVQVRLGSDDGVKMYLNGNKVWENHIHRGLGIDSDIVDVRFRKGANRILLKIEQAFGAYEFCIRITDSAGKAVRGVKVYMDHPSVKEPIDPAKQRTISASDYLIYKCATTKQALAFSAGTAEAYRNWRKKFLGAYRELLGAFPKNCALKPKITEEVCVEDFRLKRVLIDLEPGYAVPCLVTVPKRIKKGQKLPAVLCLHGHGAGKSDMIGSNAKTQADKANAIALHCARKGYVTISPDFLAFGERAGDANPFGFAAPCPAQFTWAQTVGQITTTLNIHTVRRCVDYLETLPNIDTRRIAAVGHSFGGYMTTMSTAVEPKIKVAVISGYLATIGKEHGQVEICGSQVVPGLFKYGDLSDIACTIAPRPILVISGLYDYVAPIPFAEAAFRKINKAYALAGAEERAKHFTFPGEHVFHPASAMEWLERWL
ncbi:MAG: alpha/beta fold hydrolase [Planctomycetota bacterium]